MTWVKVDDRFPQNPKVLAAGKAAAWAYLCGLCYASQHLTDGHLPDKATPAFAGKRDVERLVRAGLWIPVEGGYQIHDYLEHQPSREQHERKLEANRERQRKWYEALATRRTPNGVRNSVPNADSDAFLTTTPSRPVRDGTSPSLDGSADAGGAGSGTFRRWQPGDDPL